MNSHSQILPQAKYEIDSNGVAKFNTTLVIPVYSIDGNHFTVFFAYDQEIKSYISDPINNILILGVTVN